MDAIGIDTTQINCSHDQVLMIAAKNALHFGFSWPKILKNTPTHSILGVRGQFKVSMNFNPSI